MTFSDQVECSLLDTGRYQSEIKPGWETFSGRPNGGYLLALLASSMTAHAESLSPISITAHFLSPGEVRPVEISCTTIKSGRLLKTVAGTLISDKPILHAVGAFGQFRERSFSYVEASPPELPKPEDCLKSDSLNIPFLSHFDRRIHPDDFGEEGKSQPGRLRGWFKLNGDQPITPLAVLLATDAFPPSFRSLLPSKGWAPTVELTVHQLCSAVPGWLAIALSSKLISNGLIEEDAEIWDSDGNLVARSRQLCLAPKEGAG